MALSLATAGEHGLSRGGPYVEGVTHLTAPARERVEEKRHAPVNR